MSAAVEEGRLTASRDAPLGGQAVLEGVMMRGVNSWALAVRKPPASEDLDLGEIDVQAFPLESWAKRRRLYRLPVIRGVVALVESLAIGMRALGLSANAQLARRGAGDLERRLGGTVAVASLFAIGLFFVVPVGLTSLIKHQLGSSVAFWAVEGVLRTSIFLGYLVLLSRLRDLRRVFEYHGAEHKAISCYEASDELTPRAGRAVLAPASALRHELPADRDDHGDLRVRADRAARLVDPRDHADRRRAGDRRPVLRGDQVGGAQPRAAVGPRGHVPRACSSSG